MFPSWTHKAAYNRWMNERLYEHTATLSEEERTRDRGAFFGSIHGTLAHILVADSIWLQRLARETAEFVLRTPAGQELRNLALDSNPFPRFEDLRRERARFDDAFLAWVDSLDESMVRSTARYRNMGGETFEHPLWWALEHLFNHQTHHRGQVTTLLYQAGVDPGVTDFIAYLRSHA